MTLNKSQSCNFMSLYAAISRVCSVNNLNIATKSDPESVSRNVVYKEIFNNSHK